MAKKYESALDTHELLEHDVMEAIKNTSSYNEAAKQLGISRHQLLTIRKRLARKGYAPECDLNHIVPDGYALKGTSTLYNKDGDLSLQWVKTDTDRLRQQEMVLELIAAMKSEIKPTKPVAFKGRPGASDDLANMFVLTDYHCGMFAWGEECGSDWDLEKAEDMAVNFFAAGIANAPPAKTAILCQLGDFSHFDSTVPETPASRHQLDAAGRSRQMVRVSIRILRRVVTMLLEKYEHVHLINAEGNHDPHSSGIFAEVFHSFYELEPRLTVDVNPTPFYCYEFGKVSLFFHHGHKVKFNQVAEMFTGRYREVYGRTEKSYVHIGHFHHHKVDGSGLMLVEQHPTLAPKDAYSARGGFLGDRYAHVITYHKEHGEVSRSTYTPDMLK